MARSSYRLFDVQVSDRQDLTPHFVRITLSGPDLDRCGTTCLDQRAKVVFADPDQRSQILTAIAAGSDWLQWWYTADPRPPMRTYTVKAVRPHRREVDIDFVRHGPAGPAGAFAEQAQPGDRVLFVGPDADAPRSASEGLAWRPGSATQVLLVGDETAAPAITTIVESLPAQVGGLALIEVPDAQDAIAVDARGVEVRWLARGGGYGNALAEHVHAWAQAHRPAVAVENSDDPQLVGDLIWDEGDAAGTGGPAGHPYAWIAGEAGMVTGFRRLLVRDYGFDRRHIAFMGYWKQGVAEGG